MGKGSAGILGVALQLLLIGFLLRLAIGIFKRRAAVGQTDPTVGQPNPSGDRLLSAGPVADHLEFALAESDLSTFEKMLTDIQLAWSRGDADRLSQLATPEIAAYLEQQLKDGWSRGVQNRVEQVKLLNGDVNETWREGDAQYATVTIRWSAVDYTVRAGTDEVVSGDPRNPVETTEVWTSVLMNGDHWRLSAIQQV